ncbi:hypothetical protein F5883DRAFT_426334, partial [Diaporthe sp. PMI_573]
FICDCDMLKAIDDLIRFALKGVRSIYIVIVLDVYSFKLNKSSSILVARYY